MGTAELPTTVAAGFVGVCWGAVYAVRLILADDVGLLVWAARTYKARTNVLEARLQSAAGAQLVANNLVEYPSMWGLWS